MHANLLNTKHLEIRTQKTVFLTSRPFYHNTIGINCASSSCTILLPAFHQFCWFVQETDGCVFVPHLGWICTQVRVRNLRSYHMVAINNLQKELSNSVQFSLHAYFLCSRRLLYHRTTRVQRGITLPPSVASYRIGFRHTWGTTAKVAVLRDVIYTCNQCRHLQYKQNKTTYLTLDHDSLQNLWGNSATPQ